MPRSGNESPVTLEEYCNIFAPCTSLLSALLHDRGQAKGRVPHMHSSVQQWCQCFSMCSGSSARTL